MHNEATEVAVLQRVYRGNSGTSNTSWKLHMLLVHGRHVKVLSTIIVFNTD